jgi:hypothetical protein
MPIVKSSVGGEDITTIIFTESEIEALIHVLSVAELPLDDATSEATILLHELQYALDFSFGNV